MSSLKKFEIVRNRKGMITRSVFVLVMVCCFLLPWSGRASAQDPRANASKLTSSSSATSYDFQFLNAKHVNQAFAMFSFLRPFALTQDPDTDPDIEVQSNPCGAAFGNILLRPGQGCCYTPLFANSISYSISVIPNIGSPKAKIKIFRDDERLVRQGLIGEANFSFTGSGVYKVCASYPLAHAVNGGPFDFMKVELVITDIN